MMYRMQPYLPNDLYDLPTLSVGQADDLKIDTGEFRVWLSRMTPADFAGSGVEFQRVTYERLVDGRWVSCDGWGRPT